MEICNLLDNEFKIAVLRKLVELEKKPRRQFNKIKNQYMSKMRNLTKVTRRTKQILEQQNSMNETKKAIESINSRIGQAEARGRAL